MIHFRGTIKQFNSVLKEIRKAAMAGYSMASENDMRRLQRRIDALELKTRLDGGVA